MSTSTATGGADTYCARGARNADPAANASNDADGDWVIDAEDTCPGTYNPCQEGTDVDGDGIDDDCDACPLDPLVAAPTGDPGLVDTDGDLTPDACDCRPEVPNNRDDNDGDFVWNGCDNCGSDPNPDQADCDGNGRGDACEFLVEDDDDDLVDDRCMDNCVEVANPDQANCNADAERWAGVEPRGDACDPTPCGETVLETTNHGVFDIWVRRDLVLIDGRSTVTQEARAGLRFCPCDYGSAGDRGDVRDSCAMFLDCVGDDPSLYDSRTEVREGWRLPTIAWSLGAETEGDEGIATYGPPLHGGMFSHDLAGTWELRDTDEPRWDASFLEPPGDHRPGVLWTHTPGASGGDFFDDGQRKLTSHFWSGVIEPDRLDLSTFPDLRYIAYPPEFPPSCWACQGHWPPPFLGIEPETLGPVLVTQFGAIDASPLVGPSLTSLDAPQGMAWVAAAETGDQLANTRMRMVAVNLAEGLVGDVLVTQGARFERPSLPHGELANAGPHSLASAESTTLGSGSGDAAESTIEQTVIIDNLVDPPAPTAGVTALPSGPSAAMSARLERLWIFLESGLVKIVDLRTGRPTWMEYPGPVLAATYSTAHRALFVLSADESVARLVRLDPDVTEGQVIGEWSRSGATTRFALAPSPDGSLWLVASEEEGEHTVAWLEVGQEVEARAVQQHGSPIVPGAAHADAMGLGLVVIGPDGPAPLGYRAAEFEPTNLGVEACF